MDLENSLHLQTIDMVELTRMLLKKMLMRYTGIGQGIQADSIEMEIEDMIKSEIAEEYQDKSIEIGITIKILTIFHQNLQKIPQQWIHMLTHDGIQSETDTIVINTSVTITEIYDQLLAKCQADLELIEICAEGSAFGDSFVSETCLALITEVLNGMARDIVACFHEGKQAICEHVNRINQAIQKSQIMNAYLVFAMLKQMATFTQTQISETIKSKFPQVSSQKRAAFSEYIQKNYEFVQLKCLESGENYIYSRQELAEYRSHQNMVWLTFIKNYQQNGAKLKRIKSMNGEAGILVEKANEEQSKDMNGHGKGKQAEQDKDSEGEKLILKVEKGNQIRVINARVCQQSWQIFDSKDAMSQIYENLKKQMELSGNSKEYVSYGVPTCELATIGGSLGKCLADINKYHDANQFFMDLSKTAAICSTISYAMAEIPILSYFIIAGGFTYSFYIACSNEATSSFKKFNQISSATMSAVGSVGSTLGGIMLGQVIIPVPFVGAFIGGVLGGFLGTKGVRDVNQFLSRTNFRQIIAYLKSKLIAGKYWQHTKHLLQRIGLSEAYFNSHTPPAPEAKDIHMTAICFCIVTFHESKRYVQFNKQKMKEHKEGKLQGGQEELFVNQFDIVRIVDFLTGRGFNLLANLGLLGNFISHFVG